MLQLQTVNNWAESDNSHNNKGRHYSLIKDTTNHCFTQASVKRSLALGSVPPIRESWYSSAGQALEKANIEAWNSQNAVDRLLDSLQDIHTFAEPLLRSALKQRYRLDLDVQATWLRLYIPKDQPWYVIDTSDGVITRTVSLLDAALHNFSRSETFQATHVDLEAAIEKKRFREDLYYRLNVLQVVTAPLRERHGDLSMLANHFSHFYSHETGRRPRSFSEDALIAMGKHDWPGNVRELANRMRRGLVLAEGRQIEARDLGLISQQTIAARMGTLEDYKTRAERQALCDVLNRHSDNLSVAARVLGVSRPTFYRLLHKHQIR